MQTTPAKKTRRLHLFDWESLPHLKRRYPASKLPNAHRTFIIGDDNPFPGGVANGVGKLSPDIPCTK